MPRHFEFCFFFFHSAFPFSLIAFFLEKLYNEYRDEQIRNKRESKSKISLERICDRICSQVCPFRQSVSKNSVYRYVIRRKSKSEIYNPIQVHIHMSV